jgi:hypothetical protein
VSFQGVGTDHPLSSKRLSLKRFLAGRKRAPTSTNVAQTLSIKARQCQDDLRSLDATPEIEFECMISMGLQGSLRSSVASNAFRSDDEWLALFRFAR